MALPVFCLWSTASRAQECKTKDSCQPCTLKLVPAESRATALAAQQALKAERYDDARRLYTDLKEALGSSNCNPAVQLELGKLWLRAGDQRQAIQELDRLSCLESDWDGNCAPAGLNFEAPIQEGRRLLAELQAQLADQTRVDLEVNVEGARVKLLLGTDQRLVAEGQARDKAFTVRGIPPGRYLVEVSAPPEYEAKQLALTVSVGETSRASVLLVKASPSAVEPAASAAAPEDSGPTAAGDSPLGLGVGVGIVVDEDFQDSLGVVGSAVLSYEVIASFEPELGALVAAHFLGPWLGANVYVSRGPSHFVALEPGAYLLIAHSGEAARRGDVEPGLHLGAKLGFGSASARWFVTASGQWFPRAADEHYDAFFGLLGGGVMVRSL
jgi:hypothetical protein